MNSIQITRTLLFVTCALCTILTTPCSKAEETIFSLKSPDSKIRAAFRKNGQHLAYEVTFRGKTVVELSNLGINIEGSDLGESLLLAGKPRFSEYKESYTTRGVHTNAVNHFCEVVVPLSGGSNQIRWSLEVRAFNDGVAYRYRVPGNGSRLIAGESSEWVLPAGTRIWHQSADNRSYEARYAMDIVGQMQQDHRLMAPAAVKFPDGAYGLITEANLVNYSDMALYSKGPRGFRAVFHDDSNGWKQEGEITSPWRVTMLSKDLNGLVNSDLIRNLCPAPSRELAHADWIKPGRSIWHWLTVGPPKLEEQRSWVDGTSQLGFEYYLVDDGWRNWNGGGDNAWKALSEIVDYGRAKNVQIWAWVDSKYVFQPEDRISYFKRASDIGLAGLKIDFPKPASATWVQWYDDVLRDAAQAHLMVDFHGAVKPTGRERTWPNEMTREAIAGREQGKSAPFHDNTLPFLRYVQGHADFTPALFQSDKLNGSSLAHELAMPIVFTSPFLCMGDHPERYLRSPAADVIKALPAVWDETIVLPQSEISELSAFARRHSNQWFIGVIGGSLPGREHIQLGFLKKGTYKLVELCDDPAKNDAFVRTERTVTRKGTLTAPLRKDGGYVAWIVPVAE